LPRTIGNQDFTNGLVQEVIWLHDGFVKKCVQKSGRHTFNGVTFYRYPSKYMRNKAISILRNYAMEPFINGMNGKIGSRMTAVFYYATLLLDYCDTSRIVTEISISQREDVNKVREIALAGMEQDHKDRMAYNLDNIDTLVDKLADENTRRKMLKAGWQRHMEAYGDKQ
jgi:hypothetical protein